MDNGVRPQLVTLRQVAEGDATDDPILLWLDKDQFSMLRTSVAPVPSGVMIQPQFRFIPVADGAIGLPLCPEPYHMFAGPVGTIFCGPLPRRKIPDGPDDDRHERYPQTSPFRCRLRFDLFGRPYCEQGDGCAGGFCLLRSYWECGAMLLECRCLAEATSGHVLGQVGPFEVLGSES